MELLPFKEWEDEEDDCLVLSDDEEMDDVDELATIIGRSLSAHRSQSVRFTRKVSGRVVTVEEMGNRMFVCSVGYGNELKWAKLIGVMTRDSNAHLVLMMPLNKRIPCLAVYSDFVRLWCESEG